MPRDKPAYCVWVDLGVIARNLSHTRHRKVAEWEARAMLLSIGKPGEHQHSEHPIRSPFTAGEENNRFYCTDDPRPYLERDEILSIVQLKP